MSMSVTLVGGGAQLHAGRQGRQCFVGPDSMFYILTLDHSLQLVDQNVRVKCLGGRELRGALRGYDELVNLVLDDCDEFIRGWLGVETCI